MIYCGRVLHTLAVRQSAYRQAEIYSHLVSIFLL
jgi:hypothetical protein